MAYPLASGAIIEATAQGRQAGQATLTVRHYRLGPGSTTTDGQAAITAFLDEWVTAIRDPLLAATGSDWTLESVVGQAIYPQRYRRITRPVVGGVGSLDPGQAPGIAAVIQLYTQAAGTSGSGLVHLPGIPSGAYEDGLMAGFYRLLMDEIGEAMADSITTTGGLSWEPIIYRRSAPTQSQRITGATTMPQLRTMRRRVVGRGI